MKKKIFLSSAQKELAEERLAIRDFLRADPLLSSCFDVFLFEEQPAADHSTASVYLQEVGRCDLYIALLGNEYGREDREGFSPTHREFLEATLLGKPRLVFIKGQDDSTRSPKLKAFISDFDQKLIRRRFDGPQDLTKAVHASLIQILRESGVIQDLPFDECIQSQASLDDLNPETVSQFLRSARNHRQLPIPETASMKEVLTHLNLLRDERPTNAALLLFGKAPQRFFPAVEIRCMHFHGTTIQRPAPYYRIFKGDLFTQIEQSIDFVLSKLDYSVGTREQSSQAPGEYELPPAVIREAIVNAVAHRDYTNQAAIQISVFTDRVEIRNPGGLLPPLTPELLHTPHASVARNHHLCEALYLASYIEKYGTGILMMIQETAAKELPEPDFDISYGEFVITLWRDWLTPERIEKLGLNARQKQIIPRLKADSTISTTTFQTITGASRATSKRDLEAMVDSGLLERVGAGRGAHYRLAGNRLRNGSIGSGASPQSKTPQARSIKTRSAIGSEMAQSAQNKPRISPRTSTKGPQKAPIGRSSSKSVQTKGKKLAKPTKKVRGAKGA